MEKIIIISILLCAILFCGCTSSPDPVVIDKNGIEEFEYRFTEADNGKTVNVKSGGYIVITLDENPSTGYTWVFKENQFPSMDSSFVESGGLIGSGGKRVIRYIAGGADEITVIGEYKREWESKEPEKTFTLHVVIDYN